MYGMKWLFSMYPYDVDPESKAEELTRLPKGGYGPVIVKEVTGATPLMLAVIAGDSSLTSLHWLLGSRMCDVKVTDRQNNNLLHLAVLYDRRESLTYLISSKMLDTDLRNEEGDTPLGLATKLGRNELLDIFEAFAHPAKDHVRFSYMHVRSWPNSLTSSPKKQQNNPPPTLLRIIKARQRPQLEEKATIRVKARKQAKAITASNLSVHLSHPSLPQSPLLLTRFWFQTWTSLPSLSLSLDLLHTQKPQQVLCPRAYTPSPHRRGKQ